MKIKIKPLFITLALLLAPLAARAQFTFTTNSGAITITGYNPAAGLNVVIPASTNGYPVTAIGTSAFFDLTTITNVTIGTNVTSIGDDAFYHCSGLASVTIGNSVTNIGDQAFISCYQLTSVTIPNSVTNIGNQAFEDSGLTSVTIGNSVISIGDGAFVDDGFTSVTIPNSVTSIGDGAFTGCRLTSVTIPNSVTSIGLEAFFDCYGLTNMTIGNSVTSIGDAAFESCYGLTVVTIPNSVTSIGEFAFASCIGLQQAYFLGNAPLVDGVAGSADSSVFQGETGTAYYLANTTGWGATYGGWSTAGTYQPQPQILGAGSGFGVQNKQFGFTIFWATNTSVVVEASTNLLNWTPIVTNRLVNSTNAFTDPTWTNYPHRFYRVQSN